MSRHIKNVPIASHNTFDRFSRKKKSRIRFGYGRSDTHFLECRIDFSNRQLTLNNAFQPRHLPQSSAIIAIDESVDGNSWELPVLKIAEVVEAGEP
jgi:hypothetical protein